MHMMLTNMYILVSIHIHLSYICASTALIEGYPGHSQKLKKIISAEWSTYYKCLENQHEINEEGKLFVRMLFPGLSIKLPCTKCQQPYEDISNYQWKFQTPDKNATLQSFEDLDDQIQITDQNELYIQNAQEHLTGLYFCFHGNHSIRSYFVEIPDHVDIVEVDHESPDATPELTLGNLAIHINWGNWTECSACDEVGEKFRYGICQVSRKSEDVIQQERYINAEKNLQKFNDSLPCSSRFLPNATKDAIENASATHLVATRYCKEKCPKIAKKQKIFDATKTLLKAKTSGRKVQEVLGGSMIKDIKRIILMAEIEKSYTIQCPGFSGRNIPITWKKYKTALVPETITNITNGRITMDVFGRITIHEIRGIDAAIYSCWQRKDLLGTIHVVLGMDASTEKNKGSNQFITILVGVVIVSLAAHIGFRARKMRAEPS